MNGTAQFGSPMQPFLMEPKFSNNSVPTLITPQFKGPSGKGFSISDSLFKAAYQNSIERLNSIEVIEEKELNQSECIEDNFDDTYEL
eukprot:CAMPEP_0170557970 /NCGR_PEP_ID=MMETSP0211-20121228/31676_1 /TAXON_ID=311385 /ORGANISM="Pseudokeronopsis sp., Strain OXSARD2" /LENGTH=86 /DNA_ID=CAMNT_0010869465 /DNA_START=554 /DNA_END=814 /DNA_ORIENTATION=+